MSFKLIINAGIIKGKNCIKFKNNHHFACSMLQSWDVIQAGTLIPLLPDIQMEVSSCPDFAHKTKIF